MFIHKASYIENFIGKRCLISIIPSGSNLTESKIEIKRLLPQCESNETTWDISLLYYFNSATTNKADDCYPKINFQWDMCFYDYKDIYSIVDCVAIVNFLSISRTVYPSCIFNFLGKKMFSLNMMDITIEEDGYPFFPKRTRIKVSTNCCLIEPFWSFIAKK